MFTSCLENVGGVWYNIFWKCFGAIKNIIILWIGVTIMYQIYTQGDIVLLKNVMFVNSKGDKRIDTRISGHPYLVLNDVNDLGEKLYALKLTSRKLRNVKQYALQKNNAFPSLRKPCYVNLDKMYTFDVDKVILPSCHLKLPHFKRIYGMSTILKD